MIVYTFLSHNSATVKLSFDYVFLIASLQRKTNAMKLHSLSDLSEFVLQEEGNEDSSVLVSSKNTARSLKHILSNALVPLKRERTGRESKLATERKSSNSIKVQRCNITDSSTEVAVWS